MENLTLDAGTRTVVDRMEHIHLSVADIERSLVFYKGVLGFEKRYEEAGADGGRCAHVGTDQFYIALSERPGLAPSTDSDCATIYHVGFTSALPLETFQARLAAAGYEGLDVWERKEGWAIYIYDPDGHELEVIGYKGSYSYK